MSRTNSVALSLGSNLGDRRALLSDALHKLASRGLIRRMRVSSLWESEPVEVEGDQPAYLNLCVRGESNLSPNELLAACLKVEKEAGRRPGGHKQSRPLDLDLLVHGQSRLDSDRLRLPHPRLAHRLFVLKPLAEVWPRWRHPVSGQPLEELIRQVSPGQNLRVVDDREGWWRVDV